MKGAARQVLWHHACDTAKFPEQSPSGRRSSSGHHGCPTSQPRKTHVGMHDASMHDMSEHDERLQACLGFNLDSEGALPKLSKAAKHVDVVIVMISAT